MGRMTVTFSLPESMRAHIDDRVRTGDYRDAGEYLRDLIRKDQENEAQRRMRSLIDAGLASGEGRPFDESVHAELRQRALSETE